MEEDKRVEDILNPLKRNIVNAKTPAERSFAIYQFRSMLNQLKGRSDSKSLKEIVLGLKERIETIPTTPGTNAEANPVRSDLNSQKTDNLFIQESENLGKIIINNECNTDPESANKKNVDGNSLTSAQLVSEDQTESGKRKRGINVEDTRPEKYLFTGRHVQPSSTSTQNENRSSTVAPTNAFRTARDELTIQKIKKNCTATASSSTSRPFFAYGASKKSLGSRRTVRSGFVAPVPQEEKTAVPEPCVTSSECVDERLRNIEPRMIELITNEIMHKFKPVEWDDIAGLDYAKRTIREAVVWPLLRPDIFTGLRRPPRGILLFGPPGTGKTLIGKCIASQSKSTFFSISASSLTSKWIGDGEKMVRALFAVAAVNQPSIIFIDEIDSLLSSRSETEHESSRRIKTEFLVQLDGAATSEEDRILIVGATNRPQELDEAARRRLVRRLYIPLPELEARCQILLNLLGSVRNSLKRNEVQEIGNLTEGYSGADMETLCREAAMEPIRSIPPAEIPFFSEDKVREVCFLDFKTALQHVRASVSAKDLDQYLEWNRIYGAGSI